MPVAMTTLAMATCLLGQSVETPLLSSYLYQPAYSLDCELRGPARPYVPEPGDIMLCTDFIWYWTLGHDLAGAGHPHHCGIVVALPDGRLGILEAGPHDKADIAINEALPHLRSYEAKGPVWVRKRRVPLTGEESARLSEFAQKQTPKRFAVARMFAQMTVVRSRGPLRTFWVGGPNPDRSAYFCAELCMDACVAAGLLDSARTRPSASYPQDIFMDASLNPFLNKYQKLSPRWDPPARWTSSYR